MFIHSSSYSFLLVDTVLLKLANKYYFTINIELTDLWYKFKNDRPMRLLIVVYKGNSTNVFLANMIEQIFSVTKVAFELEEIKVYHKIFYSLFALIAVLPDIQSSAKNLAKNSQTSILIMQN